MIAVMRIIALAVRPTIRMKPPFWNHILVNGSIILVELEGFSTDVRRTCRDIMSEL
jgi:hypothetical protein